jgi:hypothetical protein
MVVAVEATGRARGTLLAIHVSAAMVTMRSSFTKK